MTSQNFLTFGLEALKKSRALILKKSRNGFSVTTKADNTLVTEVRFLWLKPC